LIQDRFGDDMRGELDGSTVDHGEMQAFGELSVYYHMDISEVEYKDMTETVPEKLHQPGIVTVE